MSERRGTTPRKFKFELRAHGVSGLASTFNGKSVILQWSHSGHVSTTIAKTIVDGQVTFDQDLDLRLTLYHDSARSTYLTKPTKLSLKQVYFNFISSSFRNAVDWHTLRLMLEALSTRHNKMHSA
eukprot:TRINITY_DN5313_c0_g1_i1.p1 TRINITY_DN5313_c0_g1~~TRINITY_DN5313_c0_g1_i1.p1  ORF type:complete len:144 (+),score=11.58 TRINITY_DN5313_c0_g1_i1:59-433(+)